MKKVLLALVLVLAFAAMVAATETVSNKATLADVSLTKLIENLAVATPWGNAYFNQRDIHRLVHSAAKMRPIDLGVFLTDQNVRVQLIAKSIRGGKVTFEAIRR